MTVSYKKVSISGSGYYLDGFLGKARPADEVGVLGATWLVCGGRSLEACAFLALQTSSSFTSADVKRFQLLARGVHPNSPQQPLVANAGHPDRVALHDFTLSAPKSVSVVWALSPPEVSIEIQRAQHLAAQAFLEVLAEKAAETRQGRGGRIKSSCPLVSCLFDHSTSRDLDPQLHTHCAVFNLTVREDGSTGAVEVKQMLRWIGVAATIYHSELARHLIAFGFELDFSATVFEIKCVPESVRRLFSKRREAAVTAANLEMSTRDGVHGFLEPSRRQMQCAVIRTRRQKRAVPMGELRQAWLSTAQRLDMRFALDCRTGAIAKPKANAGNLHSLDTPPSFLQDCVFPLPTYKRPKVYSDFLEQNMGKLPWYELMDQCDAIIEEAESSNVKPICPPAMSRRASRSLHGLQGGSIQI